MSDSTPNPTPDVAPNAMPDAIPRPNITFRLPLEVRVFARIAETCPQSAVAMISADLSQVYVYFDPADAEKAKEVGLFEDVGSPSQSNSAKV